MGEEHGESAPFQFFTSHSDKKLVEAVRKGRRDEFASFGWQGEVPDPQAAATFLRSKVQPQRGSPALLDFYKELLRLRRSLPTLAQRSKQQMEVIGEEKSCTLFVHRWTDENRVVQVYQIRKDAGETRWPLPPGTWHKVLDSADSRWQGPGGSSPDQVNCDGTLSLKLPGRSFVVYRMGC